MRASEVKNWIWITSIVSRIQINSLTQFLMIYSSFILFSFLFILNSCSFHSYSFIFILIHSFSFLFILIHSSFIFHSFIIHSSVHFNSFIFKSKSKSGFPNSNPNNQSITFKKTPLGKNCLLFSCQIKFHINVSWEWFGFEIYIRMLINQIQILIKLKIQIKIHFVCGWDLDWNLIWSKMQLTAIFVLLITVALKTNNMLAADEISVPWLIELIQNGRRFRRTMARAQPADWWSIEGAGFGEVDSLKKPGVEIASLPILTSKKERTRT